MSDIINLYPKSSCSTWECKGSYPIPSQGVKSNLSVKGTEISPYFDCYDRVELSQQVQPTKDKGWYELNPQIYLDNVSKGFFNNPNSTDGCPEKGFLSYDPRQFSSPRAEWLTLDRPPPDGNVKLDEVYDKKYDRYGIGFNSYENIRDGDISYYIDKSIQGAFYNPVYAEPSKETTVLYQDPMGGMRPQYNRQALINTENPTVTTPKSYPYSLSFIQDTQSFREDIIALQQRKHNESKWSARWAGIDN